MQETRAAKVSRTALHALEQKLCLCCVVSLKPTVCDTQKTLYGHLLSEGQYHKIDYEVSPISKERLLHGLSIHSPLIHLSASQPPPTHLGILIYPASRPSCIHHPPIIQPPIHPPIIHKAIYPSHSQRSYITSPTDSNILLAP